MKIWIRLRTTTQTGKQRLRNTMGKANQRERRTNDDGQRNRGVHQRKWEEEVEMGIYDKI